MVKPIMSSAQARASGFKAIKTVRGKLISLDVVESKFKNEDAQGNLTPGNDQVELKLYPAEILEMDEGVPMMELTDNTFTYWYNYAPAGEAVPKSSSPWVKAFLKSAEALKLDVDKLMGTNITLTKKTIPLFTRRGKDAEGNKTKEDIVGEYLVLVADVGSVVDDPNKFKAYVIDKVVGKNAPAALKALATDDKTRNSEYIKAARVGKLAELLGLKVDKKGLLTK